VAAVAVGALKAALKGVRVTLVVLAAKELNPTAIVLH